MILYLIANGNERQIICCRREDLDRVRESIGDCAWIAELGIAHKSVPSGVIVAGSSADLGLLVENNIVKVKT